MTTESMIRHGERDSDTSNDDGSSTGGVAVMNRPILAEDTVDFSNEYIDVDFVHSDEKLLRHVITIFGMLLLGCSIPCLCIVCLCRRCRRRGQDAAEYSKKKAKNDEHHLQVQMEQYERDFDNIPSHENQKFTELAVSLFNLSAL